MKVFPFPQDHKNCPVCGSRSETDSVLIPIAGTQDGNNMQAIPVHLDCLSKGFYYTAQGEAMPPVIIIQCKE
jgi:hypothetical protein